MIEGRCALITGSTSGLGLAIAEHLAGEGCNIVLTGLEDPGVMNDCRKRLEEAFSVGVLYRRADLSDPAEIAALMQAAAERFSAVDILVNNAVVRHFAPLDALSQEDWNTALAVNLSAPFHATKLVVPGMRERNFGRIVNVASVYSFIGTTNRIDYVTTKTGLIGMTRAVALETAGYDITCNAICPGTVLTPNIEDRIQAISERENLSRGKAEQQFLASRQPVGRFIESKNVAALVSFLCGQAGRDITGTTLPIDGGWTAR